MSPSRVVPSGTSKAPDGPSWRRRLGLRSLLFLSVLLHLRGAPALYAQRPLLWQLNSGGYDIQVVDPATGEQVRRIEVGPEPHGIAAPSDGRVVYVSLEANDRERGELLWIDASSFEITHRLEVGPEPHEIAVTPDGRWIYVPCRDGHYWVVDGRAKKVVKRIRTGGRPHNTRVSRDGRFMYLSPMGDPEAVTVVDVEAGHRVVGTIGFGGSVRPPAIAHEAGLFFQHVDGLNGFEVADLRRRDRIARVEHEHGLGWFLFPVEKLGWLSFRGLNRCHGIEVRPGETEVWSVCGERVNVHAVDPDVGFPEIASVVLPEDGYWITFSPDGSHAFVPLSEEGRVAVIETSSKDIVRFLPAGEEPKRNLVILTAPETDSTSPGQS